MCEVTTIQGFIHELQELMEESNELQIKTVEFRKQNHFGDGVYAKEPSKELQRVYKKQLCLRLEKELHPFTEQYFSITDRWQLLESKFDSLKTCDEEQQKELNKLNKEAERFAKDIDAISRDLVLFQTHFTKCLRNKLNIAIRAESIRKEMKAKGLIKGGKTRRKYRHSKKMKSNRKTR